jgi:hypothetical protein
VYVASATETRLASLRFGSGSATCTGQTPGNRTVVRVPVMHLCLLQQLAYCRLHVQSQEKLLGYYLAGSNESYDVVYLTTASWTTHEYYCHGCWTLLRKRNGFRMGLHLTLLLVGLISKIIYQPIYITPTDTSLPTV